MARDRFNPVALHALRSLAPSDPLAPLVARAMQARVPHQRNLNIAPRSEAYLDGLSEADPRDLSNREALLLRNAPVSEEMDPMEREPDADYDDPRGMSNMASVPAPVAPVPPRRMVPMRRVDDLEMERHARSQSGAALSQSELEQMRALERERMMRGSSGAAMTQAELERMQAMRGGR